MAEIRESQKALEETLRKAKVDMKDMKTETDEKLRDAKRRIEKIREEQWNQ